MARSTRRGIDGALREERGFVAALGGYSLEIAGGTLVTNERVPVPRFNFVQQVEVAPERQSAFFERALDHYFQRALRPTFRAGSPVPAHVDRTLRGFGFRRRADPHSILMLATRPPRSPPDGSARSYVVREAEPAELDTACRFWVGEAEATEFRRALEVAWTHPNPGERIAPWVAVADGRPVAASILYSRERWQGIHSVATLPSARGQGAATALVDGMLDRVVRKPGAKVTIESDAERLERRLGTLGFVRSGTWQVYELPPEAELSLPDPGPPQPPRWRPPRSPRTPP